MYDHIFRFGSNVCMNSVIACSTMAWCTVRIIKGLDFCVIPKLLVTFFLFPLINVLNIHVYIFCDLFRDVFGIEGMYTL